MSYSNQMIVHAVDTMESYLNNKLPETKLWEHSFIKKQIDRREYQENFTIEDHIRGMVYSMLSSGAKWDRVVDGIDDSTGKITPIDELFHNYNMEYILSSSSDFFTERIKEICGATQSTRKQMEALIKNNIPLLSKIENQYGSIDSCYKKYIAEDSTLKGLIEKLSSPESFFKMNQMGEALNAEYLRNVGYDIAKPDRHIRRILGSKILGCSKYETVPIYEAMDIIQSIAEQMGKHCAEVDYLLWMYCANGYGEVCTVRNPKCDICVIRNIFYNYQLDTYNRADTSYSTMLGITLEKKQSADSFGNKLGNSVRLQGGGFGLKGAAKGIAKAETFNFGMSALGKFVSHQLQMSDEEKAQIFSKFKEDVFFKEVYNDYLCTFFSMIQFLADNGILKQIYTKTGNEYNTMINNLKKSYVPER